MVRVIKCTKQICKDEENNSTESNFVEKVLVNLVYIKVKVSHNRLRWPKGFRVG
jgi:hypothetical protein